MTDSPAPRWPDYPFVSHLGLVAGFRMHYVDEGTGDPVVCVHGNPTWSYYFRRVIQDLRSQYRVVALDHIGCGLSDKPSDREYPYRLKRRIDDLELLLDQLDIRNNIRLVLHDWGGMIGMGYAARHPERIRQIVLLNTAAFALPAAAVVPWQLRLARTPGVGDVLMRGLGAFSRGAVQWCVTKRPLMPDVAKAYCAPYQSWSSRRAVLRFVQDIPLDSSHPSASTVAEVEQGLARLQQTPKLIGWGHQDFVFTLPFLDEWKRREPNAKYLEFPDCGHFILEDAAQEMIPAISQFFRT